MRRVDVRRIGLVGCMAAGWFTLGATLPKAARHEEAVALQTDAERLVLPWVGKDDLLRSGEAPHGPGQRSSISLEVDPPEIDRGWELTVRTAAAAGPSGSGRRPRVYWKLASQSPFEFRPLGPEQQLVKRSREPSAETITIDVVFGVDWNVVPGRYDVDFVFALEPL